MAANGERDATVETLIEIGERLEAARQHSTLVNRTLVVTNESLKKILPELERVARGREERNLIIDTESNRSLTMASQHLAEAKATYEKTIALARDELRSAVERVEATVTEHRREDSAVHRLPPHEPEDGDALKTAKLILGLPWWRFLSILVAAVVLLGASGVFGAWWRDHFGGTTSSVKVETHERHAP
jgi:hypothetical protein